MDNNNQIEKDNEAVQLSTEDKVRIAKSMILILLFATMIVSSMTYYNAPNINPNLVFESGHDVNAKHDKHVHDHVIYRLNSRTIKGNRINLVFAVETMRKKNVIKTEFYREGQMSVIFSKNKARIRIIEREEESQHFEVPSIIMLNFRQFV